MRWNKRRKEDGEIGRGGSIGLSLATHGQACPRSRLGEQELQSTNDPSATLCPEPHEKSIAQADRVIPKSQEIDSQNCTVEGTLKTEAPSDKALQPTVECMSIRSSTSYKLRSKNKGGRLVFDESARLSLDQKDERMAPKSQILRTRNSDGRNHSSAGSVSSSITSSEVYGFESTTSGSSSAHSASKSERSSKGFPFRVSMTPKLLTLARSDNSIYDHPELLSDGGTHSSLPPSPLRPPSNVTPTLATPPGRTKSIRSVKSFRSTGDNRERSPFRLLAARNRANSTEPDYQREPRKASFLSLRSRRDSDSIYSSSISNERSSRNGTPQAARSPEEEYFKFIMPSMLSDESPRAYLSRIMKDVKQSSLAGILSKRNDTFHQAILREYLATFVFDFNPLDMALRKLLMECKLPAETQQIDRVLDAFAFRYQECNPSVFTKVEDAFIIAFSLMMLHTDAFNKSNKHKMTKAAYVKNTLSEAVSAEVLECFYDNITYTPFIHCDEDTRQRDRHKSKTSSSWLFGLNSKSNASHANNLKTPLDPYVLIIENRLEILRPSLEEVFMLKKPLSYHGTSEVFHFQQLRDTFIRSPALQIISAKSRPNAYLSPMMVLNPIESRPGIVEVKVYKVGFLMRREAKKNGRGFKGWRQYGAILTGSQLFFSKHITWISDLIQQINENERAANKQSRLALKPPISQLLHDDVVSMVEAIALMDGSGKTNRHMFAVVTRGGMQEWSCAESEDEMNDWITKINYVAALRVAGILKLGMPDELPEFTKRPRSAQSPLKPAGTLRRLSDENLNNALVACRKKLATLDEQIGLQTVQLEKDLKDARQLSTLAPILSRTREMIVLSAGQLSARLKWSRIGLARLRCYREILHDEALQMELKLTKDTSSTIKTASENGNMHDGPVPCLPALDFESGQLQPKKSPSLSSLVPLTKSLSLGVDGESNGDAAAKIERINSQTTLSTTMAVNRKALQRSLREHNIRKASDPMPFASAEATRAREGLHRSSGSFVMQGKFKCSVVDVSPDLSTLSKHYRTISQTDPQSSQDVGVRSGNV